MDAVNFTYWLNGFAELHGDAPPTREQWKSIREHLELCFKKVTPPVQVSPGIELPQLLKDWVYRPGSAADVPWWMRQAQCAASGLPNAQSYC